MPAKVSRLNNAVLMSCRTFGERIRLRRKALGISAVAAAEAAGISRVTWYRLEKGEPAVTMGAYQSALDVLGLTVEVGVSWSSDPKAKRGQGGWVPVRIILADYPQLEQLAWQIHGVASLTPLAAYQLYQRNVRHLDFTTMLSHERALYDDLQMLFETES